MTFATNVLIDSSHNLSLQGGPIYYGTCATAAATTAKVVTCANFALATGALIFVKFSYANSGAVASLTMDVNGTGAKPIKEIYNGAVNNLAATGAIVAGPTYLFSYDGTNWVMMNNPGYNSTYSTMSVANAQGGTNTSSYLIRADRMAAAIKRQAVFKVTISSISSLPVTKTVTGLTADHIVISSQLSVPSAQGSDWTITSAANSITVSGTFNGTTATDLVMIMGKPEAVTGS